MKSKKRTFAFLLLCFNLFTFSNPAIAGSIIRDAEIEAVVSETVDPILKQVGKNQSEVSIYIIADPAINAFVQGGQNIFINTGLLIALDNHEELAAVIAHELGHITGGHLLKTADAASEATFDALITGAVVGIAAGLSGGGGDAIAGAMLLGSQAGAGSFVSFTRTQESAADQAGLQYLKNANINPDAMKRVLKKLSLNEIGATNYMRSHPLSKDRIENLSYHINQDTENKKYLSFNQQRYKRMQAKLFGFLEDPNSTIQRYSHNKKAENQASTMIALASAYHKMGDVNKAHEMIEKMISEHKNDSYILDLAGQIALENGKIDKAIDYYRQAYENNPKNALIGLAYGQALVASEKLDNIKIALPILKACLLTEKKYAKGYRDLSIAYDRIGEQGYAASYSAEYFLLRGEYSMAVNQARKALLTLDSKLPEALRARDILFFAENNKRS